MLQKRTVFLFAVLAVFLCSCGKKYDYSGMSAQQIFTEASAMAEKGGKFSSERALEMFKEIQLRHSFSPYAPVSSLKTADVYFNQKKYRSSADQYRRFISANPRHPMREHALYRLSKSFYSMKESHKRDQSPCRNTIYWSLSLLSNHPETQHRDRVQSYIEECYGLIAKNELEIGKFYLKRKKYKAARRRFIYLADNFPNTGAAAESKPLLASIPPEKEDEDE